MRGRVAVGVRLVSHRLAPSGATISYGPKRAPAARLAFTTQIRRPVEHHGQGTIGFGHWDIN